jgi:hypothetical protein
MRYLLISIGLFFTFYLNAQTPNYSIIDSKRDYNWTLGLPDTTLEGSPRGIHINFTEESFSITNPLIKGYWDRTNASISDEEGNLLFTFNGQEVMDNNYEIAINGTGINPHGQGEWWYWEDGYPPAQSAIILPDFNDSTLYHIFHLQFAWDENIPSSENPFLSNAFLRTTVRKTSLDTQAEVIEKNSVIFDEYPMMQGKLTATRHANGRDWWIPVFYNNENRYHQFLYTPEGVLDYGMHYVDSPVFQNLGQAKFSPNGTTYVQHNGYKPYDSIAVDIFDFNRCTGLLSNQKHWIYPTFNSLSFGAAISPNSRYLYLAHSTKMLQLDLYEDDPFAEIEDIGTFDGFGDPSPARFFAGQLAPDGKIYFCASNGVKVLHVIHNPDEQGIACNFEQHGVQLPYFNNASMPTFPNFRLGRLEGSDCDTLYSSNTSVYNIEPVFSVFPNPARDVLEISWEVSGFQSIDVRVLDILGREVVFSRENNSSMRLDVSGWAVGVYVLQLEHEGQVLGVEKVVRK